MNAPRGFKNIVAHIKALPWETLKSEDLLRVMHLSHASAREFAEALRIALRLYPDNVKLREMAQGELDADNLSFDDYRQPGDHAEFLAHFLAKIEMLPDPAIDAHIDTYRERCRELDDETRAMTIFSREGELEGIFERILQARGWPTNIGDESPDQARILAAFQYYLGRHRELDTGDGGHHDLTKEFPVDERVAPFYEARLQMYRAVSALFRFETVEDATDRQLAVDAQAFIDAPTDNLADIDRHLLNIGDVETAFMMAGEDAPPEFDALHIELLKLFCQHHINAARAELARTEPDATTLDLAMRMALDSAKNLAKGYQVSSYLEEVQQLERRVAEVRGS